MESVLGGVAKTWSRAASAHHEFNVGAELFLQKERPSTHPAAPLEWADAVWAYISY